MDDEHEHVPEYARPLSSVWAAASRGAFEFIAVTEIIEHAIYGCDDGCVEDPSPEQEQALGMLRGWGWSEPDSIVYTADPDSTLGPDEVVASNLEALNKVCSWIGVILASLMLHMRDLGALPSDYEIPEELQAAIEKRERGQEA